MKGSSRSERDASRIAELALASETRRVLHEHIFEMLKRSIGFDIGAFLHTSDGNRSHSFAPDYDARLVEERMVAYLSEFSPDELRSVWMGPMENDVDILSNARRDRLGIYRELFRPNGVTAVTTTAWRDALAFSGFHLARTGRGARFRDRELAHLRALLPTIRLAVALVGATEEAAGSPLTRRFRDWATWVGLSPGEQRVAELATRGLQNHEIASVLGVSPSTVRNHMASVFRKGQVTTRTELAFVVASSESAPGREEGASRKSTPPWLDIVRPPR